jgi:hypothetical protein
MPPEVRDFLDGPVDMPPPVLEPEAQVQGATVAHGVGRNGFLPPRIHGRVKVAIGLPRQPRGARAAAARRRARMELPIDAIHVAAPVEAANLARSVGTEAIWRLRWRFWEDPLP